MININFILKQLPNQPPEIYYGNKEYISRTNTNIKFENCDIKKLKLSLKNKEINIRI